MMMFSHYYGGSIVGRTYGTHKNLFIHFYLFYEHYLVLFTMVPRNRVTKQAVTKVHLDGKKKQVRNSAHGTSELWYTIPYQLQPNNTWNVSMALYVHSEKNENEKENKREKRRGQQNKAKQYKLNSEMEKRKKGETKQTCAQGAGRVPRAKVAVCWHDQPYEMSSSCTNIRTPQ